MINLPLMRPLLPFADKILPYLNRIDQSRWYSNEGPLVLELEERLGSQMNCFVAATSSCTIGMAASMMAMEWKGSVTLPSWTFVATANAVKLAGCDPYFTDVSADGSSFGYVHEDETNDLPGIGVSVFGSPISYVDNGHPFLIDAAAGFDTYMSRQSIVGDTPVVISTHATKVFSTGEGGLVLSTDRSFIQEIKYLINHGLNKNKEVLYPGTNGKMSEYHSAVGLASLKEWPDTRHKWIERKEKYHEILGTSDIIPVNATSTMFTRTQSSVLPIIEKLQSKGIMSRQVWGRGAHDYQAYKFCQRTDLTETKKLADTTLFLPFFIDMTNDQMKYVAEAVHECV